MVQANDYLSRDRGASRRPVRAGGRHRALGGCCDGARRQADAGVTVQAPMVPAAALTLPILSAQLHS
jgi:hypothetical protein